MLSSRTAWSGMTLLLVPAWTLPTVSTAISPGATSRDTTVCSRTMIMAASTTGSTVFCGMEPWPPRPYTVTLMLSAADMNGPGRVRTVPAMPGSTCWARATSGPGMRLSRPSSTMSWAPSPVSSAGWNSGDQRAVPAVAVVGHELGHAEQAGHVHVVAAGVHRPAPRGRWRRCAVTVLA